LLSCFLGQTGGYVKANMCILELLVLKPQKWTERDARQYVLLFH